MQPGFAAIGPGGQYGMSHDGSSNDGSNTSGMHHPNGGLGGSAMDSHSNTNNGGGSSGGLPQPQSDYTLAGILHYLQSEWRRYERDRNEWEIERAEMRARVALLEGERRSIENLKTDLMRRVKMLEFALRQERSKYIAADGTAKPVQPKHAALQQLERGVSNSGRSSPAPESVAGDAAGPKTFAGAGGSMFNTLALGTLNGMPAGAGAALSRQPSAAKDAKARAKSRDYLKQCLQEITYLTSPGTLNPLPERAAPGSVLGQGPTRPRKALTDNPPTAFQAGSEAGSMLMGGSVAASAKRQRSFDRGGNNAAAGGQGSKTGPRGLQLVDEPLMEREEEDVSDAQGSHTGDIGTANTSAGDAGVEGLALDKASLVEDFRAGDSSGDSSSGITDDTSPRSTDEPITAIYRNNSEDWAKLREAGRAERDRREAERADKSSLDDEHAQLQATSDRVQQLMQQNVSRTGEEDLASLSLASPLGDREMDRAASETASEGQMWKPKKVLRGHLDAVRAVAFDASDLCLYSASDDNTIKFWKLDDTSSKAAKSTQGPQEIDPLVTLRGHSAAVTSLALSSSKRILYSGSVDSSIVAWKLMDGKRVEPYPPFDKSQELGRLVGHTQAVWDLCLLPTRNDEEGLLASASSDGTIKIWATKDQTSVGVLQLTFDYFGSEPSAEKVGEKEHIIANIGKLPIPTSIAPCMSDLRQCAVAFSNSIVKLFDVQTGREVLEIKANDHWDGTEASQINKVISHPTLPLLMTAHENNYIQIFDANTGTCSLSMVGHLDSVTTLDIDPSGLTLVSGGHDCSVRFWDIAKSTLLDEKDGTNSDEPGEEASGPAICVQEITAHRKKGGEGVLQVRYHPNAPWFCSAGADGVVRLYG